MDQSTQQNAAMVEESTAASHALLQEATRLMQLIGQFKVEKDSTSYRATKGRNFAGARDRAA